MKGQRQDGKTSNSRGTQPVTHQTRSLEYSRAIVVQNREKEKVSDPFL